MRCSICAGRSGKENDDGGTKMQFLTQLYAPADQETKNENAFHRTLYVFGCPDPVCSSSKEANESVVVLRGQLAKVNPFLPESCQDLDIEAWQNNTDPSKTANVCIICGQFAKGKCPKSKQFFCCRDHQRAYHRALKQRNVSDEDNLNFSSEVYAESELVVEEEPKEMETEGNDQEKVAEKLGTASMFSDIDVGEHDENLEQSDLNNITGSGGVSDQTTIEFYSRIGRGGNDTKEQCLRYSGWCSEKNKADDVLWISSNNKPGGEADIPPCQYCGSKRKFEFQIMPQMINFLSKDSHGSDVRESEIVGQDGLAHLLNRAQDGIGGIDWGTIAVYTCSKSCGDGQTQLSNTLGAYREEFAWRQPPL